MRSKRQQQQSTRRIRRERRRLGRFVAFSEMLADITPKPLIESSEKRQEPKRSEHYQQRCPVDPDCPAASPESPASATPGAR